MDLSWVSEKFTKGGAQAFLHSSTMELWSASAVPPGGCWLLALLLAGRPGAHSQELRPSRAACLPSRTALPGKRKGMSKALQ